MCIIVYKPAGEKFPSWNTLKNCFNNNPDGAGFMFADEFGVHVYKGFMDWQSFKNALKPHKLKGFSYPFVVHFRITTHGGTSKEMTQPFPLTSDEKTLRKLNSNCKVGVAHNGIIPLTCDAKNMSDTAKFVKEYMTALIDNSKYYKNPRIPEIIEELINSKMCILSNDGHVEILGNGWEKVDGIYYSNGTYRKSYYTKLYGSYMHDDDWGDAWDRYYHGSYGKKLFDNSVDCHYTETGDDTKCISCPNYEFCFY